MCRLLKTWRRGGMSAALATAGILALSASAFGTSNPARPAATAAAPSAGSWSGFYAGLNAGWGRGAQTGNLAAYSASLAPPVTAGVVPFALDFKPDVFFGGGQLGYNWQSGATVFGIETDLQAGTSDRRSIDLPPAGGFSTTHSTADRSLDWFGTLRGRFGFAQTGESLYYLTGGLAYGGMKNGASVCFPLFGGACDGFYVGSSRTTKIGWTIGAGAEYAWQANWSLKIEYLYVDLGSGTVRLTDPLLPGDFLDYRFRHRDHIVRLGINYRY